MAGLIGSLHSAGTGMSVSQASIQTTSHNINNINTPGYSRQRVEQSAKNAYSNPGYNSSMGPGQIGTGVQATDVIRIRNTFYDFQYRSESHNYGEISIKYQHYTNIEKIFNEPSDSFEKQVHCVDLTESTIEANKRFFESAEDVPRQAYTMGIKTIMQAKKILVVASGEDKAQIVKEAFFGHITPYVPASVLQLHNDVTLVADEAALSKIY